MYGDRVTDSMQRAIDETDRRREKQLEHNRINNIVPVGIKREVTDILEGARGTPARSRRGSRIAEKKGRYRGNLLSQEDLEKQILSLEKQMFAEARDLAFEEAASLRDQIEELRQQFVRG